jgi:hypothetical protein
MPQKQEFFKGLSALALAASAIFAALHFSGWVWIHPHTGWILLYNVALTAFSFLILSKGMGEGQDGWSFYNHFMGNASFRLLLTAGVIFGYFYWVKENQLSFTFTFFACYFAFTIFEIRYLLANLRHNSERLGNTDGK